MKKQKNRINEYLFVDGYNIINQWDIFKELLEDYEEARLKLIDIMVEYKHYKNINVIIVFDAHLVKGNSGLIDHVNGVKIVYTKENETADNYIEREADKLGKIKNVRVATSDWMEQQIILGRGAIRISARELEGEILGEKRLINRSIELGKKQSDIVIGKLEGKNMEVLKRFLSKEN